MTSVYRFSAYELDCQARELRLDGAPVAMPARSFECLQVLIERRDRAVSRDELVSAVFRRHNVSDAQLGQIILRARRVVGDDGCAQHVIRTVPRFGFRWVAETSEVDVAAPPPQLPPPSPVVSNEMRPPRPRRQAVAAAWLCAAACATFVVAAYVPASRSQDPERVILQAQQDFLAGRYQRGLAALDHLLEAQGIRKGDARLRARALLQRARLEIRLDRHGDAEQDFSAAIDLLDQREDPALLGKALNGRAVARTALGKFDAAQADLRHAHGLLSRSGDRRSVGWVAANLAALRKRRTGDRIGDPGDADPTPDTFMGHDAAVGPAEDGSRSGTGAGNTFGALPTDGAGPVPPTAAGDVVALGELSALHRQLLEWPEARRHAAAAWAMRDVVPDAVDQGTLALGLAETLLGSGRLRDAGALLAACAEAPAAACDRHRLAHLSAELAWRRGDPLRAFAIADQAVSATSANADSASLRRLLRLSLQLGLEMGAATPVHVDAAHHNDDSVDAWLIRALVARTHGMDRDADLAYRQALARAEGVPADVVATAKSYLPWLIEQGAYAQAATLAARVAPWAAHDYDAAMLQLELSEAVGDAPRWRAVARNARRLAGERPLPITPPTTADIP